MWIADKWKDYEIIDCSKGEKLERWGSYLLVRPDPQVIWIPPELTTAGRTGTDITTGAKRAAGNGSSSSCPSSGRSITKALRLT